MNKYLENLTNTIIGKNRLDVFFEQWEKDQHSRKVEKFIEHVSITIEVNDLYSMRSETLGQISKALQREFDMTELDKVRPQCVVYRCFHQRFVTEISLALAYVIYCRMTGRLQPIYIPRKEKAVTVEEIRKAQQLVPYYRPKTPPGI